MSGRIWVVEMLCFGQWGPTVGVQLTQIDARRVHKEWQARNPDDDFRLRCYTRRAETVDEDSPEGDDG